MEISLSMEMVSDTPVALLSGMDRPGEDIPWAEVSSARFVHDAAAVTAAWASMRPNPYLWLM